MKTSIILHSTEGGLDLFTRVRIPDNFITLGYAQVILMERIREGRLKLRISGVITAVMDDEGNKINVGERDIFEKLVTFLERSEGKFSEELPLSSLTFG